MKEKEKVERKGEKREEEENNIGKKEGKRLLIKGDRCMDGGKEGTGKEGDYRVEEKRERGGGFEYKEKRISVVSRRVRNC